MANNKCICAAILAVVLLVAAILGIVFGVKASKKDKGIDIASTGDGNPAISPTVPPTAPITSAPSLAPVTAAPTFPGDTLAPSATATLAPSVAATASPTAVTPAPIMSLEESLMSLSLGDGSEFLDAASPQSRALAWVSGSSTMGQYTEQQLTQRYALAAIFYATNGAENPFTEDVFGAGDVPTWSNVENWLTATSECEWFGVECNAGGNVTGIEMTDNIMSGSLPRELVLLKDNLEVLDVRYNTIYNDLDDESQYWSQLTNMRSFLVGYCYIVSDGIPTFFGDWTELESMDISYTVMHGDLRPEVWEKLVKLEYLEAGGNFYNTSLPRELYELPLLTNLYMDASGIEGNIDFLEDMDVIFEVWLDNNLLTGTLPKTLSMSIESISLTGNLLTGPIPDDYSTLVAMQQFWIYDNSMTGTIPAGFGDFTEALVLQFDDNQFSGDMPAGICSLKNGTLGFLTADCGGDLPEVACPCCDCCESPCFDGA